MGAFPFLAALPAILAFAGFAIYELLRRQAAPNPLLLRVVDKLRAAAPDVVSDTRLRPAQVERILHEHNELRQVITTQDYELLKQILRHQFLASLLVYSLVAALCIWSIFLFLGPSGPKAPNPPSPDQALVIDDLSLQAVAPVAQGRLVDTDTLEARWTSRGRGADIHVFLENIESKAQTNWVSVPSSSHRLSWSVDDYRAILAKRDLGKVNRVRVVCQTSDTVYRSDEFLLNVGLTLLLVVRAPRTLDLIPTVDSQPINRYTVDGTLVVPAKPPHRDTLTLGPPLVAHSLPAPRDISAYNWQAATLTYNGPDDPLLVRTNKIIDYNVTTAAVRPADNPPSGIWRTYLSKTLETSTMPIDAPTYRPFTNYYGQDFKRGMMPMLRPGIATPSVVTYRIPKGAKSFVAVISTLKETCDPGGAAVDGWQVVFRTPAKESSYDAYWYIQDRRVVVPVEDIPSGTARELSIRLNPNATRTCDHAVLGNPYFTNAVVR